MSFEVEVVPVAANEQPLLRRLADYYAYDFSDMLSLDTEPDGQFEFADLATYWTDAWRHPFFLQAAGELAGFALVQERSRLSGVEGIHDMAEFFVMRRYRRLGGGERAARQIFERFRGPWEVRVLAANAGALLFWRRVIDRFTEGRFREVLWNDDAWRGPVLLFTS